MIGCVAFAQKKKPAPKKQATTKTTATKTTAKNMVIAPKSATVATKIETTTTTTKEAATTKPTTRSAFYKTPYATRNSGSFDKSTHLISLTYGFPNTLDYNGYFYSANESGIGPVTVRYEFPIREEAGVGLSVSGATKKWDYYGGYTTKITGISISPLGFYHFNKLIPITKLDVYAAVGASIDLSNYSYDDPYYNNSDTSDLEINPAGLVGARYYFTEAFSAMAEVGEGSYSIFRIGVSFRL
ncbi:hypothetical protein FNO01nite_13060 [Flavobacterium noncentrifugens]|nr:hypothetical protein FNO01nite_13060 [Flavobacterium noncentrifugens]